jgi:hypothetical protein
VVGLEPTVTYRSASPVPPDMAISSFVLPAGTSML